MKTKEQTIRELRKKEVLAAFFKLRKDNPTLKMESIFKELARIPAPRYYATPEVARRFVALIAKNKPLPITNALKREMYFDIYKNWQKDCLAKNIPQLRPGGSFGEFANTSNITETFLDRPAPSFYLNYETMRGIVYRELRKK